MQKITPTFCAISIGSVKDVLAIEQQANQKPWKISSIKEELSNANARCFGARLEGSLIAFSFFHLIVDVAHLMNIAVLPDKQSLGVGKQLLSYAFEELTSLSITTVQLEVRESNRKARVIYEQLGFYESGGRQNYYQDNGEDAILYDLKLDYLR